MNDIEQSVWIEIEHIESCQISLSRPRSRNYQCTLLSDGTIAIQFSECFALHIVGLDVRVSHIIIHIPAFNGKVEFGGISLDSVLRQFISLAP